MPKVIESEIEEDLQGPLCDASMLKLLCDDVEVCVDEPGHTAEKKPMTTEERFFALILNTRKPAKQTVREMSREDRAEYMRQAKRKSRAASKEREAAGYLDASADNIRDVLADAAIAILAAGGEEANTVRKALQTAFPNKAGVWLSVEAEARNGKLVPKHVRVNQTEFVHCMGQR